MIRRLKNITIGILFLCSPIVIHKKPQEPMRYIEYTMKPYETIESVSYKYKPEDMDIKDYLKKVQVISVTFQMPGTDTVISLPIYK